MRALAVQDSPRRGVPPTEFVFSLISSIANTYLTEGSISQEGDHYGVVNIPWEAAIVDTCHQDPPGREPPQDV